jgi:hypothetical protein
MKSKGWIPHLFLTQGGRMKVATLEQLRAWCIRAELGQEEDFSVPAELSETEASNLAFAFNQDRDGHVWLDVKGVVFAPEATTHVHVRCTN